MRRARAQAIGRGLGAIGFMLLYTAIGMATGRCSAAIGLWFVGGLILMCCVCGARHTPLRQLPIAAWAGSMALGLLLMGLGVLWTFIYKTPWGVLLTLEMLLAALATLAIGLWVYQRAKADRRTNPL